MIFILPASDLHDLHTSRQWSAWSSYYPPVICISPTSDNLTWQWSSYHPPVIFVIPLKYIEGYIVFAFPFVYSFVHTYVRSFVFQSGSKSFCVKIYKTLYYEDPLMDFICVWHDGRYTSQVLLIAILPRVWLRSRSDFSYKSQNFCTSSLYSYIIKTL